MLLKAGLRLSMEQTRPTGNKTAETRGPADLTDPALLLQFLKTVQDILVVQNREGRYLFVSSGCLENLEPDAAVGKLPSELPVPLIAHRITERLPHIFDTKQPLALEESLEDGAERLWYSISMYPLMGPAEEVVAVGTLARNITSAKALQTKLRDSERTFRSVLETAKTIAVTLDRDGRIVFCNDYLLDLTGWKRDEVLGKDWFSLFLPGEIGPQVFGIFQSAMVLGSFPVHFENDILTRSGEKLSILWSNTTVLDVHGRITGTTSLGLDITARKKTETALRFSEEKYRLLADSVTDIVGILDFSGVPTYLSPSVERSTGWTPDDLIGHNIEEYIFEGDLPIFREALQKLSTGLDWHFELRAKTSKHEYLWFEVLARPVKSSEGAQSQIVISARDISERKRIESELREYRTYLENILTLRTHELHESEKRFRASFELGPVGMVISGPDDDWLEVNDRFCEIVGYSREDLRSVTWSQISLADELADEKDLLERLRRGEQEGYSLEKHFIRQDGGHVHAHIWVRGVHDEQGILKYLVRLIDDISGRKELEFKLRQSERLASLGTFAAGIAHEINNPLNNILAAARAALSLPEGAPGMTQILEDVIESVKRCAQIVGGVLKFARQDPMQVAPTDVNSVIRAAIKLSASWTRGAHLDIQLNLAADLPMLDLQALSIEQALANLIFNAVQAEAKHIAIASERQDNWALLRVCDDGHGIPAEHLSHVFDPFYTTRQRQGGTGLGLSLVHGIVSEHGGMIDAVSNPEEGTIFSIRLPISKDGVETA